MRRRRYLVVVVLLFFAGLAGSNLSPAQGALLPVPLKTVLHPGWATGVINISVGAGGIVVTDLNQDGVADIVASSGCWGGGFVFVLNRTADGDYQTVFSSEQRPWKRFAIGDRDRDGKKEIYAATCRNEDDPLPKPAEIHLFRTAPFGEITTFILPGNSGIEDLGVADVDGDNRAELVVVRSEATYVYDAQSFALKWQADGKGGNRLGIADIDGDGELEIVVNGRPAHILDATLKSEKWSRAEGFGDEMVVGDVDGDGRAEIIYLVGRGQWGASVRVFDADTRTEKWSRDDFYALSVAIADPDRDGVNEVLVGLTCYRGSDGLFLWELDSGPLGEAVGTAVGDVDGDGVNELVWGGGLDSTLPDRLCISDWQQNSIEWKSDALYGPLFAAVGDVDHDGRVELVMASGNGNDGYGGGLLRAYDAATHQIKWTMPMNLTYLAQLAVGQLDADPALEIVVVKGGENSVDIFDGQSRALEWSSSSVYGLRMYALLVRNIDADAIDELIFQDMQGRIFIWDGRSGAVQWQSNALGSGAVDIAVGDLDGNGLLDLAVLTDTSFTVWEMGSWRVRAQTTLPESYEAGQIAIVKPGPAGPGALIVGMNNRNRERDSILLAWAGDDLRFLWQQTLGVVTVSEIAVADFDRDGWEEFTILGYGARDLSISARSLLLVCSLVDAPYWLEFKDEHYWGDLRSLAVGDLDNDGRNEIALSSYGMIVTAEIEARPRVAGTTHMPIVSRPSSGWITLVNETFEGDFPGSWQLVDTSRDGLEYLWWKRNCRPFSGGYSGWAVGGGGNGIVRPCGGSYQNNIQSWMVYGPFSLADASAADLRFKLWLKSEPGVDGFCRMASVDGNHFVGRCVSGDSAGQWVDQVLDLSSVGSLGNLLGRPQVWIAFLFISNASVDLPEGAYVDNIILRKCPSSVCINPNNDLREQARQIVPVLPEFALELRRP